MALFTIDILSYLIFSTGLWAPYGQRPRFRYHQDFSRYLTAGSAQYIDPLAIDISETGLWEDRGLLTRELLYRGLAVTSPNHWARPWTGRQKIKEQKYTVYVLRGFLVYWGRQKRGNDDTWHKCSAEGSGGGGLWDCIGGGYLRRWMKVGKPRLGWDPEEA